MFKKILATLALLLSTAIAMAAVDVNKASEAELDSVKGIGPTTSKLIVNERKKGDFKSWDDFITRVKGVGDKRAENLSEAGLTVGGAPYKPASTTKKDDKATGKTAARSDEKRADAAKDAKDAKADAKKDAKDAKADAKADVKKAQAEAKKDKAEASADAKEAKAEAKADAKKAAASSKK